LDQLLRSLKKTKFSHCCKIIAPQSILTLYKTTAVNSFFCYVFRQSRYPAF